MKIMGDRIINFQNLLLLGILTLALLLRMWGISGLGLPRVGYMGDEPFLVDTALEILRQDRLDFSQWDIGYAQIYLQAVIEQIILKIRKISPTEAPTYREITSANQIGANDIGVPYPLPEFYLWGRAAVAMLGGCSALVIYLIGTEIKSSIVGLISAFFLAVMFLHAEYSHYLMRTVPGAFLLLLSLYAILVAYRKQKWSLFLLSFALVYLAIYTKQNNLILLAPLSLVVGLSLWHKFQHRSGVENLKSAGLTLGALTILWLIGLALFRFNVFTYAQAVVNRVFNNPYLYGGYHFGVSGYNTLEWLIDQIFLAPSANWRLVAFLAIPGVWLALQLKVKGWLLLSVLLPYLIMVSLLTVRFTHWLIPILLMAALLAALSLEWIYDRLKQMQVINHTYLAMLLGLIVILIPGASLRAIITMNYYASQPDVRNVAGEWLQHHLPSDSKIVIDSSGPYVNSTQHDVMYVQFIGDKNLSEYRAENVDYLVLNSMNFSVLMSAQSDLRAQDIAATRIRRLSQMMQELPLEHKFSGPALLNGPVVDIYVYRLR